MKYLAILRDSLREALDTWILYVTLGIFALIMLLVVGTSFRPLSMKEELDARARQLTTLFRLQDQRVDAAPPVPGVEVPKIVCEIRDFEQTNDAAEPWNGDYRFTFAVKFPAGVRADVADGIRTTLPELVRAMFWRLNIVSVKEEDTRANPQLTALMRLLLRQGGKPPSYSGEFRLKVTSRGTKVTRSQDWSHEPVFFFGALPMHWLINSPTYMVYWFENRLVNTIAGWVLVLLAVVTTSSFLPNLLRKGSIDLVLSKPVSRARLLLFKYLGGLTFVFVSISFLVGVVYLWLGYQTGIWAPGFLLSIGLLTFFFAILYSVSTLTALLTRSGSVCILVTIVFWALLWVVGIFEDAVRDDSPPVARRQARQTPPKETRPGGGAQPPAAAEPGELPPWVPATVRGLYTVMPRTRDLGELTTNLIADQVLSEEEQRTHGLDRKPRASWGECLGVSAAFIAVMLGLSCWIFARRDF